MSVDIVVLCILFGMLLGAALVPRDPEKPDVDVAMEKYRDSAVAFSEATLKNFGTFTTWNQFLFDRKVYLKESE